LRFLVPRREREKLATGTRALAADITALIGDLPTRETVSEGFSVDLTEADFDAGLVWITSMIAGLPSLKLMEI